MGQEVTVIGGLQPETPDTNSLVVTVVQNAVKAGKNQPEKKFRVKTWWFSLHPYFCTPKRTNHVFRGKRIGSSVG
jgi:hypothetical protein